MPVIRTTPGYSRVAEARRPNGWPARADTDQPGCAPPVKSDRAIQSLVNRVLDDALDRGKAGAAGDEQDGFAAFFPQEKGAQRALKPQDFLGFHLVEHILGKRTTRDMPDMQLQEAVVMRRVGQAKAAALAILEHDVDVLPGKELQTLTGGQFE